MTNSSDTSFAAIRTFAALVQMRRIALGLTQRSLGRRIGVTHGAVSSWESGRRLPRAALVPDVAEQLRVTAEQIAELIVGGER